MGVKTKKFQGKGTCKKGEIVLYNGKRIQVIQILDYCPETRKSYIMGCSLTSAGKPLFNAPVLAGYDWEKLQSKLNYN